MLLGGVILRELTLDGGLRERALLQVGRLAVRYEGISMSRSPVKPGQR